MNFSTGIVLFLFCLMIGLILFTMIKDKKNGKSNCGGNCGGCQSQGLCHDPKAFFAQIKEQEFSK